MEQAIKSIGVLVFVCGAGASFAFGFAIVCQWMRWTPINVNVTIHNPPGTTSSVKTLNTP